MTPPLEFREWLSAFRGWMTQQPRTVWAGAGVALLVLGGVLYVPAFRQARRLLEERSALSAGLQEAEKILSHFRSGQVPALSGIHEAPEVLSQLQALARTYEIHFLEIAPGQLRSSGKDQPVILPVEIRLEGEYRPLGEFLGSLRQFQRVAVLVRGIRISREEQRLPQLRAQVSLELTFLPGSHGP